MIYTKMGKYLMTKKQHDSSMYTGMFISGAGAFGSGYYMYNRKEGSRLMRFGLWFLMVLGFSAMGTVTTISMDKVYNKNNAEKLEEGGSDL